MLRSTISACWLLVWVSLYLALRLAAPYVTCLPAGAATLVSTVVFMLLSLAIVVAASGLKLTLRQELASLLASVLVCVLANVWHWELVADVSLIAASVSLGLMVSRLIDEPTLVLPVAVAAGIVDLWGVNLGGPVAQALKHAPKLAERMTAKVPLLGSPQFVSMIGAGDFVFLALFFACLARFSMNVRASVVWCALLLSAAMLIVVKLPLVFALPGLPFLALGVLLPNTRSFRYTREEAFALLYAGGALVGLLVLLYVAMHHGAVK